MRLGDLNLLFCRHSSVAKVDSQEQPAVRTRRKMTLEAMTRPAQTKSLKAALRQR